MLASIRPACVLGHHKPVRSTRHSGRSCLTPPIAQCVAARQQQRGTVPLSNRAGQTPAKYAASSLSSCMSRHISRRQLPATCTAALPERREASEEIRDVTTSNYELIIVGSGNGACAFLAQYLDLTAGADARRVLVIEEGVDFLSTSFYTHQANWSKSYAQGSIYKLHHASTGTAPGAGDRPIITGRACTLGGGGSINYSMMHESSGWLAESLGAGGRFDAQYWADLQHDLTSRFDRSSPAADRTPVAETVHGALITPTEKGQFFKDVPSAAPWIPSYEDGGPPPPALGRVYTFNTQFNDFGERTASGVSLVARGAAWRRTGRVDVWTNARVEQLNFDNQGNEAAATGLRVRHLDGANGPKVERLKFDPARTSVVLAAGSGTPRLLLPHRDALGNPAIGRRVNDHVLIPVGFYTLKHAPDGSPVVSPRDQYLPLFALQEVEGVGGGAVVVSYDFFAGPLSQVQGFE